MFTCLSWRLVYQGIEVITPQHLAFESKTAVLSHHWLTLCEGASTHGANSQQAFSTENMNFQSYSVEIFISACLSDIYVFSLQENLEKVHKLLFLLMK